MGDPALDHVRRNALRAQHLGQEVEVVARPGEGPGEQRPLAPRVEAVVTRAPRRRAIVPTGRHAPIMAAGR